MKPSTAYKVEIRPGIKAIDNVTLAQTATYNFVTHRPKIQFTEFRAWKSPVMPVKRVVWDQPVTKSSVLQHLYFQDANNNRVPTAISADVEKRKLPRWLHLPGEKVLVHTNQPEQDSYDQLQMVNGEEARRVWVVEPVKELPPDQSIELHIEPGLVSALGPMPSVENRSVLSFETFGTFTFLGVHCTDDHDSEVDIKPSETLSPTSYCNPMRGVSLQFSAPLSRKEVRDHIGFNPSLSGKKSDSDPWGDLSEENDDVTSPRRSDHTYSVYLPFGLKPATTYMVSSCSAPIYFLGKNAEFVAGISLHSR